MTLIMNEKIIKEDLGPYRINYKSILQIASHSYEDIEDVSWAYDNNVKDGFLEPLHNNSAMFVIESEQYFLSYEQKWINFDTSCNGRVDKKIHWNTLEYWTERNQNFYEDLKSIDYHNALVDDLQEGVLYKAVIDANRAVPSIDKDLMSQTHDDKYYFKKVVNYADKVRFDYDVGGRREWNNFHNKSEYIDSFTHNYWQRNPEFIIKQKIESVK
tara:strand:- start:56 stop:697 length:642 start_codon:yes stop_codon:yes gene_type:complete